MNKICIALSIAMAISPFEMVYAAKTVNQRSFNWPQFVSIVERLKEQNRNKPGSERVSCSGPDGTTVDFTTTGTEGRDLSSVVKVKAESRTVSFSSSQISNFYNADDRMAMDAFYKNAADPYFSFRADLAPTTAPQVDEVATHTGTVTVTATGMSAAPHKVTCSTFRKGAGLLKPQTLGVGGNIAVKCFAGEVVGTVPLVSFDVANNPSLRLISDVKEVRSSTEFEVLPSFLVSQFRFTKAQLNVDIDDGSSEGNLIARLALVGDRVPTGQVDSENAIFGIWGGTYERFDTGRTLNAPVTCYGKK